MKKRAVRGRESLMHSMLVATMMMVAGMMSDMKFFNQHERKLCISGMEFQFEVELAIQKMERSVILKLIDSDKVIKKAECITKTAFCFDDTLHIK